MSDLDGTNKILKQLPSIFQTEVNKKFFQATFEQSFSKDQLEKLYGFIGRKDTKIFNVDNEHYISASSKDRYNYQLEPSLIIKDLNENIIDSVSYIKFLNYIKNYGGNINDHNKLFQDTYYSFSPPIDVEKIIKYQNFYWSKNLDTETEYIESKIKSTGIISWYLPIEIPNISDDQINNLILNQKTYTFVNVDETLIESNSRKNIFEDDTNGEDTYFRFYLDENNSEIVDKSFALYKNGDILLQKDREQDPIYDYEIISEEEFYEAKPHHPDEPIPEPVTVLYFRFEIPPESDDIIDLTYEKEVDFEVDFMNGLRVTFPDSVSYKDSFTVEGVGNKILLVKDESQTLSNSIDNEVNWGWSSSNPTANTQRWGKFPWDSYSVIDEDPSYIIIERGALNRNDWSRINKWFHLDVINYASNILVQVLSKKYDMSLSIDILSNLTRAERPIIEFIRNIKLFDYPEVILHDISLASDSNDTTFEEIYRNKFLLDSNTSLSKEYLEKYSPPKIDNVELKNKNTLIFIDSNRTIDDLFLLPVYKFGPLPERAPYIFHMDVDISDLSIFTFIVERDGIEYIKNHWFAIDDLIDQIVGITESDAVTEGLRPGDIVYVYIDSLIVIDGSSLSDNEIKSEFFIDVSSEDEIIKVEIVSPLGTEVLENGEDYIFYDQLKKITLHSIDENGHHIPRNLQSDEFLKIEKNPYANKTIFISEYIWSATYILSEYDGWVNDHEYDIGDIILPSDKSNDDYLFISKSIEYINTWESDYDYKINDLVKPSVFSNKIYKCLNDHTSSDTEPDWSTSLLDWEEVILGQTSGSVEPTWIFEQNAIVIDNGIIWAADIYTENKRIYELYLLPYQSIDDKVKINQGVYVLDGLEYSSSVFTYNGTKWLENTTNLLSYHNQEPLFELFYTDLEDNEAKSLSEFDNSTFKGSKIFSYKVDTSGRQEEDNVLGISIEYESLGEVFDIIFVNNLVADNFYYTPDITDDSLVRIPGYYYYAITNNVDNNIQYETSWKKPDNYSKQYVNDFFVIGNINNKVFIPSVKPKIKENGFHDIKVEYDGNTLIEFEDFIVDDEYNEVIFQDHIIFVKSKNLLISSYSEDEIILNNKIGYYEIPQQLESNPLNEEIYQSSINNMYFHLLSIYNNQDNVIIENGEIKRLSYQNTKKDISKGEYIVQNDSSLLKSMLITSNQNLDIIKSIELASKEYQRYKNELLYKTEIKIKTEPFSYSWLDEILEDISSTRLLKDSFKYSYMISFGNIGIKKTYQINKENYVVLDDYLDLSQPQNFISVSYVDEYNNQGITGINGIDYDVVTDENNEIRVNIKSQDILLRGFVVISLYDSDSKKSYLPPTPSKLGIYNVHIPRIEFDFTYSIPSRVLVGHDGSRTGLYGDERDIILLEFEKRIYNNINPKYKDEYLPTLSIYDVRPGYFRQDSYTHYSKKDYDKSLQRQFYKWELKNKLNHRTHHKYDPQNWKSYNYRSEGNEIGNWKGIFKYYYDTIYPHSAPWEMLGFSIKPSWWDQEYSANTIKMWDDLENGYIRNGKRQGVDERFKRPGLQEHYMPIDDFGNIRNVLEIIDNDQQFIFEQDWIYGDSSPIEIHWENSSEFPYHVMRSLFVLKPGIFGEKLWETSGLGSASINEDQIIFDETKMRRKHLDSYVHGEIVENNIVYKEGYQQFISDRLSSMNKNLTLDFGDKVRKIDVQLSYEMSGFTPKKSLKLEVEGVSDQSISSDLLFIPTEDITILTDTTHNIENIAYSGVLIRHLGNNSFTVFGFNLLDQFFTTHKRSAPSKLLNVGGKPIDFEKFRLDRSYEKGTYVKHNTIFYLCLVDHYADNFYEKYWKNVPELPITGGLSVQMKSKKTSYKEYFKYNHVFNDQQEVFDFLINYGDYLEDSGFIFDQVEPTTGEILNWVKSAKDFLYWSLNTKKDGDVILLNPVSKHIKYKSKKGYAEDFTESFDEMSNILNQNGTIITKSLLRFLRDDQQVEVYTVEPDISSLYFLRVRTKEVQHKVFINNTTLFNNVIYSPLYSSRKSRLLIQGHRGKEWFGKKEVKGQFLIDDDVISNFDNLVDEFLKFYDHNNYTQSPFIELDRYLIGFETSYPKSDEIINLTDPFNVTENIKYKFYQGLIQEKGTTKSILKSRRYDEFGENSDIEIYEEWMFNIANYGNIHNKIRQEFLINDNDIKMKRQTLNLIYPSSAYGSVKEIIISHSQETYTSIPEVVIDPPDSEDLSIRVQATASVVLDDITKKIKSINIDNPGYGYNKEPNIHIYKTSFLENGFISNDRAFITLQKDLSGTDNVKLIDYDIDDKERWIGKPFNYQNSYFFPTTWEHNSIIPNAGYVHKDDIDFMSYNIQNLFKLWYDDKDIKPILNQYIWIADLSELDWNWGVFRIADSDAKVYYITSTEEALEYEKDEDGEYILDENGYKTATDQIRKVSLIYTDKPITQYANVYSAFNLHLSISRKYNTKMILNKVILGSNIYNVRFRPKFEGDIELTDVGMQSDEREGFYIYEITNEDNEPLSKEEVQDLNSELRLPCYVYEDGDVSDDHLDLDDYRFSNNSVYILRSVRYENHEDLYSDIFEVNAWVDKDINGRWQVYLNRSPNTTDVPTRKQEKLINSSLLLNSFMYDKDNKETRSLISFYDPFKNIFPGEASRNITFISRNDPSKYFTEDFRNQILSNEEIGVEYESESQILKEDSFYIEQLFSDKVVEIKNRTNQSGIFGPLQVGMTWLDTSSFKYIYYEQGDILYRNDNWGKLFPDSYLKVYEWVESDNPPEDFEGDGVPKDIEKYNIREYYDGFQEESRIKYYFWVSNKQSVPNRNYLEYRTTSIINVENLLKDPDSYGHRWSAVSSPYSIIISNFSNLIRTKDMVFQVNYSLFDEESISHKEWVLLRENDNDSTIPDYFITKMIDSIIGYNILWQSVPDARLSENEKYGTLIRPRQSWFRNLLEARRTFVYVFNRELSLINMNRESDEWKNNIYSDSYWYLDTWYEEGYNKFNTESDIQLDVITDINGHEDEYDNKIIKVETDGHRSLFLVKDGEIRLISESNGKMILRDEIFLQENDLDLDQELREIITSLFENIFINNKSVVINRIFFAMIHYVLSEQGDVDWIHKSSYIYVKNKREITSQSDFNLQYNISNRIIDYINRIKPYHVKIRELKNEYLFENDDLYVSPKEIQNDKNIIVKFDRIQSHLKIDDLRLILSLGIGAVDNQIFIYDDIDKEELIEYDYGSARRFVFSNSQSEVLQNVQVIPHYHESAIFYEKVNDIYYLKKSSFTTETDLNGNPLALRDDEDNIIGLGLPTNEEIIAADKFNKNLRIELDCDYKGQIVNPLEFGETRELGWGRFNWDSGFWTPNDEIETFITPTDGDMKFDDQVEPIFRSRIPIDRLPNDLEKNTGIYIPFDTIIGNPLDETDEYYVEVNGKYESNVRISDQGYLMFLIAIDGDKNVSYGPKPNDIVEVYDVFPLDGDGFLQPHIREGLAEEMISVDPGESLVINVDNSISDHTVLYPGDDPTWDVGWDKNNDILNTFYPNVESDEDPEDIVTPSGYHKNDFTITTINNWDERLWDRSQEQDDQDQTVYYKSKYLLPLHKQSIKSLKVTLYSPNIDDLDTPVGTITELVEGVDYVLESVSEFFDLQELSAQYDDLYTTILEEISYAWNKNAWSVSSWDEEYINEVVSNSSMVRFLGDHHDYYQSVKIEISLYPVSFRYHYDHGGSVTYLRNGETNYNGSTNYSTTLVQPLSKSDTKILVDDVTVLPVATETNRGVIWIGGERITYLDLNDLDNSISGLIRGTEGTTISNHSIGRKVFDGSADNFIPDPRKIWIDSPVFEYAGSSTPQALFLQQRPGQYMME